MPALIFDAAQRSPAALPTIFITTEHAMSATRVSRLQEILIAGIAVVWVCQFSSPVANAASITFFDGTFNDSDWQLTALQGGNGGTVIPLQVSSGGIPGSYRQVTDTVNGHFSGAIQTLVFGLQIRTSAVYSPATQGAIVSGSFAIDAIAFSIVPADIFVGFGQGQATRLILEQDSRFYITAGLPFSANQASWTTYTQPTFVQNDFRLIEKISGEVVLDNTQHPDFSVSGAPIRFGFHTANSTNTLTGYTIVAGFDNWTVTLNTAAVIVPEPGTLTLAAIGLVCCVGGMEWRRRQLTA